MEDEPETIKKGETLGQEDGELFGQQEKEEQAEQVDRVAGQAAGGPQARPEADPDLAPEGYPSHRGTVKVIARGLCAQTSCDTIPTFPSRLKLGLIL